MGPGLMRASIMRDVQREHRGRSMRVSDGREEKRACGMTLPCNLGMPIRGGDGSSMRVGFPEPVVNTAHIPKQINR